MYKRMSIKKMIIIDLIFSLLAVGVYMLFYYILPQKYDIQEIGNSYVDMDEDQFGYFGDK